MVSFALLISISSGRVRVTDESSVTVTGDFLGFCPNVQNYSPPVLTPEQIAANMTVPPPPKPTCLSARLFDEAVTSQQTALWHETGTSVRNVLFTTDDEDEEFLHELEFVFGWRRVKEETSLRIRREWGDWLVVPPRFPPVLRGH